MKTTWSALNVDGKAGAWTLCGDTTGPDLGLVNRLTGERIQLPYDLLIEVILAHPVARRDCLARGVLQLVGEDEALWECTDQGFDVVVHEPGSEPVGADKKQWHRIDKFVEIVVHEKAAAKALSKTGEGDCDRPSGKVLPDLDGQNLTD